MPAKWPNLGEPTSVYFSGLSIRISERGFVHHEPMKVSTILDLLFAERDFLFVWILNVISYRSQNHILQGSVALNAFTFFGSASFSAWYWYWQENEKLLTLPETYVPHEKEEDHIDELLTEKEILKLEKEEMKNRERKKKRKSRNFWKREQKIFRIKI